MTELDTLQPEVREALTLDQRWADAQRNERRSTHAEANYWFGQYKLIAKDAITERNAALAELAALKAGIAESAHVDVTLGCAIDGEIPPHLALCKVALVRVEK